MRQIGYANIDFMYMVLKKKSREKLHLKAWKKKNMKIMKTWYTEWI